MIITGDDIVESSSLQDALSVRFEMKRLVEADCFLNLEIKKCDSYFLSQEEYAASLLAVFCTENSRDKITPMEPNLKLARNEVIRRCYILSITFW